jgi:ribonucleoside-diphosphate reductase alpha chain
VLPIRFEELRMASMTVRKRGGETHPYDRSRIVGAVEDARAAAGSADLELGERVALRVESAIESREVVSVEEIQDAVESALIALGASEVAKAYIVYRRGRADIRRAAGALGVRDDLKLGLDVVRILEARYLRRDSEGRVLETPRQLFERVAKAVARAELSWGSEAEAARHEEEFLEALTARAFLPNSPALMNAGTPMGQLSACFVLPVEDSIEGIFGALGAMAKIHQSGGGTGFSFSRLRPRGDVVASTGHSASGPVSFMTIFDATTDVIKQGGRRRGANMGVLSCDHPDIMEFIRAKSDQKSFQNFNISVAATDAFLQAAARGEDYELKNPHTGRSYGKVNAGTVMDIIASSAWESGEPGMLFIDTINRANPTPGAGRIESTNPCGEQPLLAYESCVLGAVNLMACLQRSKDGAVVDWRRLDHLVSLGVRFLDDCIEVSRFPLGEVEAATRANRKVGLGVMGFADMLYELRIAYDSDRALEFAGELMGRVHACAVRTSVALASTRGTFANYEKSVWASRGERVRNASLTTVAPTGTIALMAGVSSGIEPRFALVGLRALLAGSTMLQTAPAFERALVEQGLDAERILNDVALRGTVRGLDGVPAELQRVFATALDMDPEWHVRMQAAFQCHVDSAVSKTVNLPATASPADVRRIYELAHALSCKGITVYRYGSRREQVLTLGADVAIYAEDRCGPGRDCAT